ncbi:MAG: hypothetical protein PWQ70_1298 [Clostridiales bacterium]|jgi:hypothetical protein|nr:hypothetical protein [Clostridiales bacterium]
MSSKDFNVLLKISTCSFTRPLTSFDVRMTSSVSFAVDDTKCVIFSVDCLDSSASFLTSSATTANPLPCSPALAASMAAFSARRLVCSDMADMISVIPPISFTESVSVSTLPTTISKAFLISL